jgi:hypothetical protein
MTSAPWQHKDKLGHDMLLEIDVAAGGNSPMDLNRIFDLLDQPKIIRRVFTVNPAGTDVWCDVAGWSVDGLCPAYAVLAEDSGDGVILLVYGGDQGIRLKPADCSENWGLESANQWGEPCLMLDKNAPYTE